MPASRRVSLILMVVLYLGAGINHFWHEHIYETIIPPYVPYPTAMVYISGACEILLALLLIPDGTRTIAAWLLISLLIAIYPANIQMVINYWHVHDSHLWIALLRLPLQFVLIWWAWTFTKRSHAVEPRQAK